MNKEVSNIIKSNVNFLSSDINLDSKGNLKKVGFQDMVYLIAKQQIIFTLQGVKDKEQREKEIYEALESLVNELIEVGAWKNRARKSFEQKEEINKLFYSVFLPMLEDRGLCGKLEGTQDYVTQDKDTLEDWKVNSINWMNLTTKEKIEEKKGKTSVKVLMSKSS